MIGYLVRLGVIQRGEQVRPGRLVHSGRGGLGDCHRLCSTLGLVCGVGDEAVLGHLVGGLAVATTATPSTTATPAAPATTATPATTHGWRRAGDGRRVTGGCSELWGPRGGPRGPNRLGASLATTATAGRPVISRLWGCGSGCLPLGFNGTDVVGFGLAKNGRRGRGGNCANRCIHTALLQHELGAARGRCSCRSLIKVHGGATVTAATTVATTPATVM